MMKRESTGSNKVVRRAIAAGNIGVDISPVFSHLPLRKSTGVETILRPGEIIQINGSKIHPGGSVANTGIAMNLLGTETTLVGRMGEDFFGDRLLQMVEERQVPVSLIRDKASHTAHSLILAMPGVDRIILQSPGANDRFEPKDIPAREIKKSCLFHFGHPPTMKKIYEDGGMKLVKIFRRMREEGLVTSLDLCAVDPASPAAKVDWEQFLTNVLPYVDFFMPALGELDYMLGSGETGEKAEFMSAAERYKRGEVLALKVQEMGAANGIIKLGDAGMYYISGGKDFFRETEKKLGFSTGSMDNWIHRKGIVKPCPVEKEVSGLGAGDVAVAAFLSAMLQGKTLDRSLYLAAAEGALCVTAYDPFSGLRPFEVL